MNAAKAEKNLRIIYGVSLTIIIMENQQLNPKGEVQRLSRKRVEHKSARSGSLHITLWMKI